MAVAKVPSKQLGFSASQTLNDVLCDSTVYIGAAVRFDGGTIVNALADSKINAQVIGIVESKSATTIATIRLIGVTPAIFTGLDTTKQYYLSDVVAGAITTSIPSTTGHIVAALGKPTSTSTFLVNISSEKIERA